MDGGAVSFTSVSCGLMGEEVKDIYFFRRGNRRRNTL